MTGKSFINITPQGPKCLKGITVTNVPAAHKMQIVILKNYHQATNSDLVTFQVIIAASIKITVFWGMASCSLVEDDRRFGNMYCLNRLYYLNSFSSFTPAVSVTLPFYARFCPLNLTDVGCKVIYLHFQLSFLFT
jgi:hypothetical protein